VQIGAHLSSLGHRSLAIIGLHPDSNVQNDRVGGIRSALPEDAHIELLWIDELEDRHGPGCELGLLHLVEKGITAFAAVSDLHALRAVTELQRGGISIPGDVSVTGFDDLIWAGVIAPTLTTMRMNMARIAEIAVADLIRQIEGTPAQSDGQGVPMQLIIRQSSGPAPLGPAGNRPGGGPRPAAD
jgi:LacI family transcriptional regulator